MTTAEKQQRHRTKCPCCGGTVSRSERIHVRLTPQEMERVNARAEKAGTTASEWARARILEEKE